MSRIIERYNERKSDRPHVKRKFIDKIYFGIYSPTEIEQLGSVEVRTPNTYDQDGMPIDNGILDERMGTNEPSRMCRTCGGELAKCPGHFGYIKLEVPVINMLFIKHIHNALIATCRKCGKVILPAEKIEEIKRKYRVPDKTPFPPKAVQEIVRKARSVKKCPYCGADKHKIILEKPYFFFENVPREEIYSEIGEAGLEEYEEEEAAVLQEIRKRREKERYNRPLEPRDIQKWLSKISDEDAYYIGFNPERARPEWTIMTVLPVAPITVRPTITLELGRRSEDDLTYVLFQIMNTNEKYHDSVERSANLAAIRDVANLLQFHVAAYINNEQPGFPPARHRNGKPIKGLLQRIKGKEGRFRNNLLGKRVNFSSRTVISPDPYLSLNEVGVPESVARILTVPVRVTPWNIEQMKEIVRRGSDGPNGANYILKKGDPESRIRLDAAIEKSPEKIAEELEVGDIVERHLQDGDIVLFNRQPSLHRMSIMGHRARILPYRTFRLNLCACHPYNADFDGDEMNLHVLQSPDARVEAEELMIVERQILSPRYGAPVMGLIQDYITSSYLLTREGTVLEPEDIVQMLTWGGYEIKKPIKKPMTGKEIFSLLLPPDLNVRYKAKMADLRKDKEWEEQHTVIIKDGKLINGVIDKKSVAPEVPESVLHIIAREYGQDKAREFIDTYTKMLLWYIGLAGVTFRYHDTKVDDETRKRMEEEYRKALDKIDKLNEEWITGRYRPKHGLSKEESFESEVKGILNEIRDLFGDLAEKSMGLSNSAVLMYGCGSRGNKTNLAQMAGCVGQTTVNGKRIFKGYRNRTLPHFEWNSLAVEAHGFIKSSFYLGLSPIEFFFHAMGGREGLVDTAIKTSQSGYMQRRMVNALNDYQVEFDGTVRDRNGNIISFVYGDDGIDPMYSYFGKAISVKRIIMRVLGNVEVKKRKEISEEDAKRRLDELLRESVLTKKIKDELREQVMAHVRKREIPNVSVIDKIVRNAEHEFERARIDPLNAVGVVAAQSIGEPGTQMTLRTFHYAGVEEFNVTLGLPRLIELVNARVNIEKPSMFIYVVPEHERDREYVEKLANRIKPLKVKSLLADNTENVILDYYEKSVTLVFSPEKMTNYNVDTNMIAEKLSKKFSTRRHEYTITGTSIKIRFLNQEWVSLNTQKEKMLDIMVTGIKRIQNAYVYSERDTEGNVYYYIRTMGSNLDAVLRMEGVDKRRTTTNDVMEIQRVLGIEAARNALIREMHDVLQQQGLDVDYRHIIMVADAMTASGTVLQIGRRGLSGAKESPLARAAFEETGTHIANAAAAGEEEKLRGTIERIIVGKPVTIGTGSVVLVLPINKRNINKK